MELILDNNKVFGTRFLVTDKKEAKKYVDGKPTDEITGYKYSVVLPDRGFEKIIVTVSGDLQVATPNQENYAMQVEFVNLVAKPYVKDGKFIAISCKADGIREVKTTK